MEATGSPVEIEALRLRLWLHHFRHTRGLLKCSLLLELLERRLINSLQGVC